MISWLQETNIVIHTNLFHRPLRFVSVPRRGTLLGETLVGRDAVQAVLPWRPAANERCPCTGAVAVGQEGRAEPGN